MKAKARMLVEFDHPCDDSYEQPCEVSQEKGSLSERGVWDGMGR